MATLAVSAANDMNDSGDSIVDMAAAGTQLADLSNDFFNSGNEIIVCDNQSVGNRVLTIKGQPDPFGRGGSGVGDITITIPTLKVGCSSFLNPAMFNSGGKCTFTVDATTTTKVAIVRLRKIR